MKENSKDRIFSMLQQVNDYVPREYPVTFEDVLSQQRKAKDHVTIGASKHKRKKK